MSKTMVIQGREIGAAEIDLIRGLIKQHTDWGRTRLSEKLCELWSWRAASGQLKDMACRTLLLLPFTGWRDPADNASASLRRHYKRVDEPTTRL